MSNFTEVSRFNELFGKRKGCVLVNKNHALVQLELLHEELAELIYAIDTDDVTEIRDGVCDVLVIAYGMGHVYGLDVDKDMEEVQQSNLSKLCTTEAEAAETIEQYNRIGVKVSTRGSAPEIVIVSNCDQSDINGKFYPCGKFLKSVNWHEPEFL